MTIDISTVKQKEANEVNRGQLISSSQLEGILEATQTIYKFSNRVIYSDIRNTGLTGYYYGNAPWYYTPFSEDANWVGQIVKMPYRPNSPLPGSNINTVASTPSNPVSIGTPNLTFFIKGCNLQYYIQIERVTVDSSTGVITFTGDISRIANTLVGAYDAGSPWLSTYDMDEIRIGLPQGTEPESMLLIDFYTRASSTDDETPGFLGAVAFIETPLEDFPQSSY